MLLQARAAREVLKLGTQKTLSVGLRELRAQGFGRGAWGFGLLRRLGFRDQHWRAWNCIMLIHSCVLLRQERLSSFEGGMWNAV